MLSRLKILFFPNYYFLLFLVKEQKRTRASVKNNVYEIIDIITYKFYTFYTICFLQSLFCSILFDMFGKEWYN